MGGGEEGPTALRTVSSQLPVLQRGYWGHRLGRLTGQEAADLASLCSRAAGAFSAPTHCLEPLGLSPVSLLSLKGCPLCLEPALQPGAGSSKPVLAFMTLTRYFWVTFLCLHLAYLFKISEDFSQVPGPSFFCFSVQHPPCFLGIE